MNCHNKQLHKKKSITRHILLSQNTPITTSFSIKKKTAAQLHCRNDTDFQQMMN